MIKRRKTRVVRVGPVKVGGSNPVSIQSMTKVPTSDVAAVVSQIKSLEKCGCEIIRVAVKRTEDARAISRIKQKIGIPLVADIHFDYRLALEAIAGGADKVRLNPGNTKNRSEVAAVVKAAKKAGISIRIGVNSGSTSGDFAGSALKYLKLFEDLDFRDIIISLKGSSVGQTVEAYRKIAVRCDYPLHLGVTASGSYESGVIKSAIGIGALLLDGIGDTIRVSLTAQPEEEVLAAKRILSSLGLRKFGHQIISCPTCGRCQVDLAKIVSELENALRKTHDARLTTKSPLSIAIMGCEVNGPGEAMGADIGVAFGKAGGMLFKKGKMVRKVSVKDAVKELLNEMD
jgi:(E)-4-hydroxy-3-methylbut-2-enyl-diphosphate synthase